MPAFKKTAKMDQYKGFVIAYLFPGFASPSILMANLLFLQSSRCRPREPELHPLFISAGGSQGRMTQPRALRGMSAVWSNWRRPWAKTYLYVLHRLGLPRIKIVGEKRVWILERPVQSHWSLQRQTAYEFQQPEACEKHGKH